MKVGGSEKIAGMASGEFEMGQVNWMFFAPRREVRAARITRRPRGRTTPERGTRHDKILVRSGMGGDCLIVAELVISLADLLRKSTVVHYMKTILMISLIACFLKAPRLHADSIRVEHGYINVTIEPGEKRFTIGTESFATGSEAAGFLSYLDHNWPTTESRPTIIVHDRDKAVQSGDELFEAALVRIEGSASWKVIRMPSPRGFTPDTWSTLTTLKKKWAEQGAGAGQPANRSEPDSEGGDKSQPESEGRSR
jgi:hypothetical protein